jgi:hypothetical protein
MKSAGFVLTILSGVGLLAIAAPIALSQTSGYAGNSFAAADSAVYLPAEGAVPVQAVLDRFDDALAKHDIEKLQAAGVKRSSAKLWQRFFRENPEATVTDNCPASELTISNDRATWTCTETATIISDGRPRSFVHVIRFIFARNNGTWLIADRR